jgi:hypothetical protein
MKILNLNVMKKIALNRIGLFLAIGFCLISGNSYSSDSKLSRKEKKEARKAELLANFQALDTLIQKKTFVIEADYLENKYGERIIVPHLLNFIKVDSVTAVLQTGSNYGPGYNGVGGVTAEGRLENWKVVKNFKSLYYSVRFTVTTNIGIYDVFMDLGADTYARATITGLTNGELIYDGHIETVGNSAIFKGQQYRF